MPEQNRVQMRGGGVLFIEGRARRARHHGAPRVRPPCGVLIHPRQQLLESSSVSVRVSFFYPIFEGSLGGLLELKMGHESYRRKALDVLFPMV